MPVTLVHPKNWLSDFDVYVTTPVVVSLYVTNNSPVLANPTVESTIKTLEPIETDPINLVLGVTEKFPYVAPETLISLLYPESNFVL